MTKTIDTLARYDDFAGTNTILGAISTSPMQLTLAKGSVQSYQQILTPAVRTVHYRASAKGPDSRSTGSALPGPPNRDRVTMRLLPGLSSDEAFAMLSIGATQGYGLAEAALLEKTLRQIADAMAVIANIDVPDGVEPLFSSHEIFEPIEDAR